MNRMNQESQRLQPWEYVKTQRYLTITEEQTATFTIGSKTFSFHFYPFRGLMYADISEGESQIANGKRVMPNAWLLPNYVAEGVGNIRFETYKSDGDDYVWWEGFNVKFRLCSYTAEELEELEASEEEV